MTKIPDLPAASTIVGDELLIVEQGGQTRKATPNDVLRLVGGGLPVSLPEYAQIWINDAGRIAMGLRKTGRFDVHDLNIAGTLNGVSIEAILAGGGGGSVVIKPRFTEQIGMFVPYGQSPYTGADSPVISSVPRAGVKRFIGGSRPTDTAAGTRYASLVDCNETAINVSGQDYGETPVYGTGAFMRELLYARDLIDVGDVDWNPLGAVAASSGAPLSSLIKGTPAYAQILAHVTAAVVIGDATGKRVRVYGIPFDHTHTDYSNSTLFATYRDGLKTLIDDLNVDIKAITGQFEDIYLLPVSNEAHVNRGYTGNPYLHMATNAAAREHPLIKMVSGVYQLLTGVHYFTGAGSKIAGALNGTAMYMMFLKGLIDTWDNFEPSWASVQGKLVTVKYKVWDGQRLGFRATPGVTSIAAQRLNQGYEMVTAANAALTIVTDSVRVVNDDMIQFETTTPPGVGAKVRYGFSYAGGNVTQQAITAADEFMFVDSGFNQLVERTPIISETVVS